MDNLYHIKSESNTVFYKFCIARALGPPFFVRCRDYAVPPSYNSSLRFVLP